MLPETDEDGNKVTLGEGVEAPVIYVLIGEGDDHISAIAEGECTEHSFILSTSENTIVVVKHFCNTCG